MLEIKIKTGGSAYRDYDDDSQLDPSSAEIIRNLKDICMKLKYGYTEGKVMDINGNAVGEWRLR